MHFTVGSRLLVSCVVHHWFSFGELFGPPSAQSHLSSDLDLVHSWCAGGLVWLLQFGACARVVARLQCYARALFVVIGAFLCCVVALCVDICVFVGILLQSCLNYIVC